MTTFSGNEKHSASELRDILAQWQPPKDLAGVVSELTGVIMILCNEVDCLKGRIRGLEEGEEDHDY